MLQPHRREKTPEELEREHQKRVRAALGVGAAALGAAAGAATGMAPVSVRIGPAVPGQGNNAANANPPKIPFSRFDLQKTAPRSHLWPDGKVSQY